MKENSLNNLFILLMYQFKHLFTQLQLHIKHTRTVRYAGFTNWKLPRRNAHSFSVINEFLSCPFRLLLFSLIVCKSYKKKKKKKEINPIYSGWQRRMAIERGQHSWAGFLKTPIELSYTWPHPDALSKSIQLENAFVLLGIRLPPG